MNFKQQHELWNERNKASWFWISAMRCYTTVEIVELLTLTREFQENKNEHEFLTREWKQQKIIKSVIFRAVICIRQISSFVPSITGSKSLPIFFSKRPRRTLTDWQSMYDQKIWLSILLRSRIWFSCDEGWVFYYSQKFVWSNKNDSMCNKNYTNGEEIIFVILGSKNSKDTRSVLTWP